MFAELILAAAPVLSPSEVTVVAVSQPAGGIVHLRAVLYSGSADDPPAKEGLASLTALAMAGSPGSGGAGPVSVSVSRDMTVFSADPPAEGLEAAYARLIQILRYPAFDPAGLDALREAQKQRLEALRTDPEALAREAFDAFAFSGHPYGHPPAGMTSAIERIGVEDLLAFYKEHCRKGNLAVGLAGDLPAGLEARVRADLEGVPEGNPSRAPRPYSLLANPRVLIVELPSAETVQVGLGHPISAARAHPDHAGLALALAGVGGRVEGETPRRQAAFSIWKGGAPSEGGALVRSALEDLARLASGADSPGTADSPRPTLFPEASTASAALDASLEDILHRSPGARDLLEASARAASAESMRSAFARHIHSGRLAIVAIVPDASAFKQQLAAQTAGTDAALARLFAAESTDTVKAADLFR